MKTILIITCITSSLVLGATDLAIDKETTWIKATAKATGHSFDAYPTNYQVHIELEGEKVTGATFSCKVTDLTTDKEKRDTEMFHWLESEHMPSMGFTMTSVKEDSGKQVLVGDFKLHDQVQQIEIPITMTEIDGKVTVDGDVTLDTRLFKLPIIKKMGFLKVQPLVKVAFHLTGAR